MGHKGGRENEINRDVQRVQREPKQSCWKELKQFKTGKIIPAAAPWGARNFRAMQKKGSSEAVFKEADKAEQRLDNNLLMSLIKVQKCYGYWQWHRRNCRLILSIIAEGRDAPTYTDGLQFKNFKNEKR